MPRRKIATGRQTEPEPLYDDQSLAKFINVVMCAGKKSIAQRIVYGALRRIGGQGDNSSPIEVYRQAVENVRPLVEVRSRRVGGATYQIPVEVRSARSHALAMRWLVAAAKTRHGKHGMAERLAGELADAAVNKGGAVKKKEDIHKSAESNKAFSHYRW